MNLRSCDCDHGFPICACCEGISGRHLLARSRYLSALADWPAAVDPDKARAVLAEYGRPRESPDRVIAWPWPEPGMALGSPPLEAGDTRGCGCGGGEAG